MSQVILYAPAIPLQSIHTFRRGLSRRAQEIWENSDIQSIGDLFQEGTLIPFDTLVEQCGLHARQFLVHRKLTLALSCLWGITCVEPTTHSLMQTLHIMGYGYRLISWIRQLIQSHTDLELLQLIERWKIDMARAFSVREWDKILVHPHKVPKRVRCQFIQFSILHRAYLTPGRLHRIYPLMCFNCPRCQASWADIKHMFWDCSL